MNVDEPVAYFEKYVGDKWRQMVIHPRRHTLPGKASLFHLLLRGKSGGSWLWTDEKKEKDSVDCEAYRLSSKWRKHPLFFFPSVERI